VLILLAIAAAVWLAMEQVGLPLTGIDDAHIFFVYGQNLTSGEGLVYNAGGEPVEGFSSLLWLLIVALGYVFLPGPEHYLLVASIILVSAALSMLVWRVNGRRIFGLPGLVVMAWVLSSPAYVSWISLPLMDTALWSALLIASVVLALGGRMRPLALATAAMVLARPEGMLWAPALIALAAMPVWVARGPQAALRQVRPSVLAFLATLAALTLWRLWTFGYPLPNTYYVKMSPDILYNLGQGANYLIAFLYRNPLALIGVVPAIAALLLHSRWLATAIIRPGAVSRSDPRLDYYAVSLVVLLALFVPVYMGGDHFGNFRFYQPAWPLLILPVLALLDVLNIRAPRSVGPAVAAAFALAVFLLSPASWLSQAYRGSFAHEITVAREGQAAGQAMNNLFGADAISAGVIRAGAIAGVYEGQIVDLMGLNNETMAHAPGDRKGLKNHAAFNAAVFFRQRPEIVLPMVVSGELQPDLTQERLKWDNGVLKGLLLDPRFTSHYRLVTISDGETTLLAYADEPTLTRLRAKGLVVAVAEVEGWTDESG
jgi:hypothetical protein